MKMTGFACYALAFACLIGVTNSFLAQDRADPQFPEDDMDAAIKSKRPFCNAFTGCGRKRSYPGSSLESSQGENSKKVRLPVPLYRALLRAATQELQETFDRESSEDYRVQDLPLIYSAYQARNAPLR